jgi:hypothetical protein
MEQEAPIYFIVFNKCLNFQLSKEKLNLFTQMSVSLENYNALVERVARLETLIESKWDTMFTPAKGPIAPPSQPPQAPQEKTFPGGGNILMRVRPATTERADQNCIYFNTGKEEDSTASYFAHTRNMKLVRAVHDPTLEPGTLQANMFTRLNLELEIDKVLDFLKMGEPVVCAKLNVRITHMGLFDMNKVPVDQVKAYLHGTYINSNRDAFVIRDRNNILQVRVNEISGEGIVGEATEVILG